MYMHTYIETQLIIEANTHIHTYIQTQTRRIRHIQAYTVADINIQTDEQADRGGRGTIYILRQTEEQRDTQKDPHIYTHTYIQAECDKHTETDTQTIRHIHTD